MKEEILMWLNGQKDYTTGMKLYEKYGSSFSLKRLHRLNGPTKETMASIDYELRQILKNEPIPLRQPIHKPTPKPTAPPAPPAKQVQKPPPPDRPGIGKQYVRPNTYEVEQLKQEVISMMKVRDRLHATLEHVSNEQRKEDAGNIITLSDRIEEIYNRLDHFEKHGVLPGPAVKKKPTPKPTDELDAVELIKLQANLRTYVSRYKAKLRKAKTPEKKAEHQDTLTKYELQLSEVERKLKA